MKRFKNQTIEGKITEAISIAESLLEPTSLMIKEISQKTDFRFNSGSGSDVVMRLVYPKELIPIFTYRPFNIFTRAVGYFDGQAIHVNIRKLPVMSVIEVAANCLHEYSHYCGFIHGSNWYSEEKGRYSVPYFISNNIKRWL
jgi:hypothetical protein